MKAVFRQIEPELLGSAYLERLKKVRLFNVLALHLNNSGVYLKNSKAVRKVIDRDQRIAEQENAEADMEVLRKYE